MTNCSVLKKFLFVFYAIVIIAPNLSRAQFVDVGAVFDLHNFNSSTYIGNGSSGVDFNQDGWDDITTASGGSLPRFFQSNNGVLEEVFFPLSIDSGPSVISVQWIDYDGDCDLDLFFDQFGGRLYLYQNDGNFNFTDVTASSGLGTSVSNYYGTSWSDYDRDGDLDVFITKYFLFPINPSASMSSRLHRNNGDGTFTDVTIAAGLLFIASPTFQGTWLDFDQDGWQDLYIIIDREAYRNRLYHNQQNGTFQEVAQDTGLDLYIDAMSITPGDFDRDDDLDIFVANGVEGNYLMRNDGNSFYTNIGPEAGVEVNAICWGSNWIDYDNNGWEDLFVAANFGNYGQYPNFFFTQNGTLPFTSAAAAVGLGFDDNPTFCSTLADWNRDGHFDFYNNNNDPFESDFWQNDGGTNHWIGVHLQGVLSNSFAVGSQIKVWTNGQLQNRYTHVGESYLSQHSYAEIIGLANETVVDSLLIQWPNGLTEKYYNLEVDLYHHFIEGETLQRLPSSESTVICPNESLILDSGQANSILWNTGATSRFIEITEPGDYWFTAQHDGTWLILSDTLTIHPSLPLELVPSVMHISCYGQQDGSISIPESELIAQVNWTTGEVSNAIAQLSAGIHDCAITKIDGCIETFSFEVMEPSELQVISFVVMQGNCPLANDGLFQFQTIEGGVPPYSFIYPEANGQLENGSYTAYATDSNQCVDSVSFEIEFPNALDMEWIAHQPNCYDATDGSIEVTAIHGGTEPYTLSWTNDQWMNLTAGSYTLQISDFNGCEHSEIVELVSPLPLSVDLALEPFISLVQMGSANATVNGGTPPYQIEWSTGLLGNPLTELEPNEYSVVITDSLGCAISQTFFIDMIDHVEEEKWSIDLNIYPNPAAETINYSVSTELASYEIMDINGRIILSKINPLNSDLIHVSALSEGLYFFRVKTKKGSENTTPFEVIR